MEHGGVDDDYNYYTVVQQADKELAEIEAKSEIETSPHHEPTQLSVNIHLPKIDPNSALQQATVHQLGGQELHTPPPTAPNTKFHKQLNTNRASQLSADYTHVDFTYIQQNKLEQKSLQVPQAKSQHRIYTGLANRLQQRKAKSDFSSKKFINFKNFNNNDTGAFNHREATYKSEGDNNSAYSYETYPIIPTQSRTSIVQRRFALKRTLANSKGLKSINTPVTDIERSNNFVFAVANGHVLAQIGYNSDLDQTQIIYSPEPSTARQTVASCKRNHASKSSNKRIESSKSKSTGNHSSVTFLYKEKEAFTDDDNDKKSPHSLGPGPQSYHIPRRPPNEKVSPSYSFGLRCFVEKNGGGRTSWEKEWFSSKDPYTIKTNFKDDYSYPTALNYSKQPSLGDKTQYTWYQYPGYSMGTRAKTASQTHTLPNLNIIQQDDEMIEVPNQVDNPAQVFLMQNIAKKQNQKSQIDSAFTPKNAKITMKSRYNGTLLWPKQEQTPGPGTHDHTKFTAIHPERPKFSMGHANKATFKTYSFGPFAVL